MEFTPIETQEQFDKVIGERVRRAEKAAEKATLERFADYDDLKAQVADLTAQLQKQTETINGHQSEVDALNAKIHTYETGSVKTAVALEMGLPYQMASRLTGDTEEAIRADAKAMVALIGGSNKPAPRPAGGGAGASTTSTSEQFASAVSEFFG